MQVSAKEYTSENVAEMLANAVAVKRRLMSGPKKKPANRPPPVQEKRVFRRVALPEWMAKKTKFDFDVVLKARWLFEQQAPCAAHLKRRCEELGYDVSEITGLSRRRGVVEARHLIIWEIKRCLKPEISYPELGRLFGGRDHTTILHAVQKIDAMKETGEI